MGCDALNSATPSDLIGVVDLDFYGAGCGTGTGFSAGCDFLFLNALCILVNSFSTIGLIST